MPNSDRFINPADGLEVVSPGLPDQSETSLRRQEVDGRMATVAYLDGFGGQFVEPRAAKVVIVVWDDGGKAIMVPEAES